MSSRAKRKAASYVVKSLEAALWAFHDARDFREAVLKAVNLGHDADTTGAICGQLAGGCWGEVGIPKDWLDDLARRDIDGAAAGEVAGINEENSQARMPMSMMHSRLRVSRGAAPRNLRGRGTPGLAMFRPSYRHPSATDIKSGRLPSPPTPCSCNLCTIDRPGAATVSLSGMGTFAPMAC